MPVGRSPGPFVVPEPVPVVVPAPVPAPDGVAVGVGRGVGLAGGRTVWSGVGEGDRGRDVVGVGAFAAGAASNAAESARPCTFSESVHSVGDGLGDLPPDAVGLGQVVCVGLGEDVVGSGEDDDGLGVGVDDLVGDGVGVWLLDFVGDGVGLDFVGVGELPLFVGLGELPLFEGVGEGLADGDPGADGETDRVGRGPDPPPDPLPDPSPEPLPYPPPKPAPEPGMLTAPPVRYAAASASTSAT